MADRKKQAARVINVGLSRLGVRLFRSNSLGRDWHVLFDHVKELGFAPRHVVDIGAGSGTHEIYDHFPSAELHLFEPLRECQSSLAEIAATRPTHVSEAVVGAAPGSITLNVHDDLIGSSVLPEVDGGGDDGEPRTVPVVTLDSAMQGHDLSGGVLVKIDVQGFELDVIAGASAVLGSTDLLIVECSLIATMDGGPEIFDVMSELSARGFALFDLIGGLERPLDGSLAQVDAVFVPSKSAWRADKRWRDG